MDEGKSIDAALAQWQSFNLEGKRNQWDAQVSAITHSREESVSSRKRLAETTKEFQKHSPEDKIKNLGVLLRSYQKEVDSLTQRSIASESAFLAMVAEFAELPDPAVALEVAKLEAGNSQKVSRLELQNKKLQQELEEFQRECAELKNQEVTVRRLEEKVREYEQQMEVLIAAKVQEVQQQFQEIQQDILAEKKERELELQRQLQQADREAERARQACDAAQTTILDLQATHDAEMHAKTQELEMVLEDLQRVQGSVVQLENDKLKLEEELHRRDSQQQSNEEQVVQAAVQGIQRELDRKTRELAQLQEEHQESNSALRVEREVYARKIESFEAQLREQQDRAAQLERELSNRPTVEEHEKALQQLQIFKNLEYDTSQDDTSVESILKDRNRKLETDLTKCKMFLSERESELASVKSTLSHAEQTLEQQRTLIARLEEDIARGLSNSGVTSAQASADDIGALLQTQSTDRTATSGADLGAMLKIISNQRDRFKTLVTQLEGDVAELQKQLAQQRGQVASLQSDNVKLYEKIRYLESYSNISRGRRDVTDIEAGAVGSGAKDDAIETKYHKLYEDSVNPFVLFNKKEKYDRYKELNAAEKVTLRMADFFLSHKYSRIFIFFYTILLHFFIFIVTYTLAHTSSC